MIGIVRLVLSLIYIMGILGFSWILSKITHFTMDHSMVLTLVGVVSAMATSHMERYRSTGGTVV